MKWLVFILTGAFFLCIQTSLGSLLAPGAAYVDFMFILVVHYALHAPRTSGLVASWLLGLSVDLGSVEHIGITSLIYGLAALCIWLLRDLLFVKRALTYGVITFIFCFGAQFALWGILKLQYPNTLSVLNILAISLTTAGFTGLWALVLHRMLILFEKPLGLRSNRSYGFHDEGKARFV